MKKKIIPTLFLLTGISACGVSSQTTPPVGNSANTADENLICNTGNEQNWNSAMQTCVPNMSVSESKQLRASLEKIEGSLGYFYPETLGMNFLRSRYPSLTDNTAYSLKQKLCFPETLKAGLE